MKKLRVAVYFTGDFPEGGATVSRLKGYFHQLKNDVAFSVNILWQDNFSNSGINKHSSGSWEDIPFLFHNHRATRPKGRFAKFLDTLKSTYFSSLHLIKQRNQIDVIYIYNPEFHYFFHVLIFAKLFRIPLVIEQTELQSSVYLQPGVRKSIFYYLKKWSENHLYLFSDAAIVISEKLYQHYQRTFRSENLYKIPVLVDEARFAPNPILAKKHQVGYIGSFGVKDGIPGLLQAFKMALLKQSDLHLLLIGNYDEHPNVLKLITAEGLQDHTTLTGRVYYQEVPDLLNSCDLLICNRINSAYANYGFPTKLVEYMALGIPVIASNTGDISRYISDQQLNLIEPENTMELYEQIVQRYAQDDLYKQRAQAARLAIIEQFNSRKCAGLLLDVLLKYAKNKRS